MQLEELVESLATAGQLVHLARMEPRPARFHDLARPLPPMLQIRVPRLWSHQAAAIDLAREGTSVAVATGTASGKSLCYQVPVAEAAAYEGGTALLAFPTKALAQDQLRALTNLKVPGLVAATYDGDTDAADRPWVRRQANVVLTNPDMLHAAVLPNHGRWANFFRRLRFVVFDELHTLRGVFGTHVAHLLRRLRRICAFYGSDPVFVFASATIGAPGRLAEMLCGLDVAEVIDDGSPRGERLFALWNPPMLDEKRGVRASANSETAALLAAFVESDYRAIAFTRSRKGTELIAGRTRDLLIKTGRPDLQDTVRPYRGGYLPHERREIEQELFAGKLRGVSATSALELGVDVGGLDACILNGFPGTIASMWQQAGRAGRAQQRSIAVLVAGQDALDQWLMSHPAEVFTRPAEPVVVNPSNPYVLSSHLLCAAYERPLGPEDAAWWAPPSCAEDLLDEGVRELVVNDEVRLRDGRAVYAGTGRPAFDVGLRTGSRREVRIVDVEGHLIGTVDEARAYESVHPGAVYLHQGQHYRVEELDLRDFAAWVAPIDPSELTQARSETTVRIASESDAKAVGRSRLAIGAVDIAERVTGYRRSSLATGESLGEVELDLPPTLLSTRAFWYTFDPVLLADAGVDGRVLPGTLHAAEHAAIGLLPLFTICDRWDVGGVSTAYSPDTGLPTIVVYDGYPGGAGIAELGFGAGAEHIRATLELIAGCPCESGCPSCVQSPKCGNLNDPLDKAGAIRLLSVVLGEPR